MPRINEEAFPMSMMGFEEGINAIQNGRQSPFECGLPLGTDFASNATPTPLPERMKNAGLKYFEYPDGFDCYALNKKNADKKHLRWQNEDAED